MVHSWDLGSTGFWIKVWQAYHACCSLVDVVDEISQRATIRIHVLGALSEVSNPATYQRQHVTCTHVEHE